MAPKKKEAAAADVLEDGPEEEEEFGPGKATINLAVTGVTNLPDELETILAFTGFCKENRSEAAAASSAPSGWALPKDRIIRLRNQDLLNDVVQRELVISLRDAAAENAVIGRVRVNLMPLLHDSLEVTAELEMQLTPEYHARWYPQEEKEDPKAKGKDKKGAPPPPEAPQEPKFTGESPPPTMITVSISVEELLGPVEDRGCWTTLALHAKGVFALPESLATLGVVSLDDVQGHPIRYSATFLGESMGDGILTKPREVREATEAVEGEEQPVEDEATWQSNQERFGPSITFSPGNLVVYRGKHFIEEFRQMLSNTGGVFLYFSLEEKPASDPKKPNPPEAADMVRQCSGRAWLDLRELIARGAKRTESACAVEANEDVVKESGESGTLLESSRTFVRLALELSYDVTPEEPEELKIHPKKLLPSRHDANKFPSSHDAAAMYREAVESGFQAICNDCGSGVQGGMQGAITQLKEVGSYDELKEGLRGAIIRVFRERLRKDTGAVPGKPLKGRARDEFISNTYSYLQHTIADVLDELRCSHPPRMPELSRAASADVASQEGGSRPPTSRQGAGMPPPPGSKSSTGMAEEMLISPANREGQILSMADMLAESVSARKAREALDNATQESLRFSRLAYEAELVGHWDRAAELLQNRFLLEGLDLREDPQEWIAFAKFCARSRGRQAAAEEALRQAVRLMAEGKLVSASIALEVDLFLACLLLDRGRYEEAIDVFRSRHEQDFANSTFRFFLGLALFLRCRFEEAKPYLESVGKPRAWFQGLPDQEAVIGKLRAFRASDPPLDAANYAVELEKLLSFGLPGLVFTFLDQTETLPKATLDSELLVLIDAKASALDRDYTAAVQRLEPLLQKQGTSREVWRLAGETYLQLQDFDRALQALQTSLSFENKFDDPAIYIRLGSVLLVKKRWKQAREAFLRSIQSQASAEAWSGVAYAEYREEEFQKCYEALCEANVLDNERPDVWAQLCLVHLKTENHDAADDACRQCLSCQPDCEELLLEVASEYQRKERQLSLAEACARRGLDMRDSGQGHSVLADVLAQNGQAEKSVLEAQIALKMLADQPEQRKAIFAKALKLCEDLGDAPLTESLHAAQKLADDQHARSSS